MSRNIDVRAVCPFFREEPSCGHAKKQHKARELAKMRRIKCEGIFEGSTILLEFSDQFAKAEHCESFCYTECWRGCPIAQGVLEKYERGENGVENKTN